MTYIIFFFFGQRSHYFDSLSHSMVVTHQILFKIYGKIMDHEKINHCDLYCFRTKAILHWLIITKYNVQTSNSLQDKRQNHWTMKYRSQWPINILRSDIVSYWLIILKYDVQLLNSFQDIRQIHWTMKYRSQWPTFILRSNVASYWLIILKYEVHTAKSSRHKVKSLDNEI